MKVRVEIDDGREPKSIEVEMGEEAILSDLYRLTGLLRESYIAILNGALAPDQAILRDGDKVRLVRVSSGG